MPLFKKEDLYNDIGVPKTREVANSGVLTLSKIDKDGKISLYKLFVQYCVDDPTETDFAMEIFGDLNFWLKFQDDRMVKHHVAEWREHCDMLRKRKAFKSIVDEVRNEGKSAFSAARYLIEEPWKLQNTTAAERKKQRKATEESTNKAFSTIEIQQDLERIKESYTQ